MQIKQLLFAASIALPATAAPLPVDDSKIVIIDKMPSIQNSDDRTAVHKRAGEYGIKIPQRWYCDEDKDEVEYVSAFGRNALGIPPHCKGDWTGKEDWKPSRQRKGDGDGESKC